MDFHPGSEEQEEDVGAGCVYWSAEFAVTCVARRVCTVHVFCVCSVCSASLLGQTLGQGVGAVVSLLGCWIWQLMLKECGSEKRCRGSWKSSSLLKLKMNIWDNLLQEILIPVFKYTVLVKHIRNCIMGNNFSIKTYRCWGLKEVRSLSLHHL